MRLIAWVLVIGALTVGTLLPAGSAGAGTYTVQLCKTADGKLAIPGWALESRHGVHFVGHACPDGYYWMDIGHGPVAADEYVLTKFSAPEDTEIAAYRIWRSVQLTSPYRYDFFEIPTAGGIAVKESCHGDRGCRFLGNYTSAFDAGNLVQAEGRSGVAGLAFNVYCSGGAPCPSLGPSGNFQIHRADVTVSDPFPPVLLIPPTGPLLTTRGALTGEHQVFVWATDRGGGVSQVQFEVDGKVVSAATIDDNEGYCRQPFTIPRPCALEARGTAGLNTAILPDGRHRLRLLVTDATGTNAAAWGPIRIRTANGTCSPKPRSEALRVGSAFRGRSPTRRVRITRYGRQVRVRGSVTQPDGAPAPGATVCIAARNASPRARLRPVTGLTTGPNGRFSYVLGPGPSRRVFFVVRVGGGAASSNLLLRVRAGVRLRPSRRSLLNGRSLTFRGRTGKPIPRKGVLVELQVRKGAVWQTFATTRSNRRGRFRYRYRFTRTVGVQRYEIRARVPGQAAYPYAAGSSRSIFVTVRG